MSNGFIRLPWGDFPVILGLAGGKITVQFDLPTDLECDCKEPIDYQVYGDDGERVLLGRCGPWGVKVPCVAWAVTVTWTLDPSREWQAAHIPNVIAGLKTLAVELEIGCNVRSSNRSKDMRNE